MPVHQQLPHVALLLARYPDAWKPVLPHQFQDQRRVAPVGLLLARLGRPDLGRISYPQLVPTLGQQPSKPGARRSRFDPHRRLLRQAPIKRHRLLRMQQLLLTDLFVSVVKDRDNLEPGMEITTYNQHRSLLPSPRLSSQKNSGYSRPERTLL